MRTLRLCLFLIVSTVMPVSQAYAETCGSRARAMVSGDPSSEVFSVQSSADSNGKTVCVVRIKKTPKDGKPPRIVTKTFKL